MHRFLLPSRYFQTAHLNASGEWNSEIQCKAWSRYRPVGHIGSILQNPPSHTADNVPYHIPQKTEVHPDTAPVWSFFFVLFSYPVQSVFQRSRASRGIRYRRQRMPSIWFPYNLWSPKTAEPLSLQVSPHWQHRFHHISYSLLLHRNFSQMKPVGSKASGIQ